MAFGSVIRSAPAPVTGGIGGKANVIWSALHWVRHDHGRHDVGARLHELSTVDFSVLRSGNWHMAACDGIGGDSNIIWVVDNWSRQFYRVSTGFGIELGRDTWRYRYNDIGGDVNTVWACGYDGGRFPPWLWLFQLSPIDFGWIRFFTWPLAWYTGIGGDSETIWAIHSEGIHELSATDFSVIRAASSPSGMGDVDGDANTIWSASWDHAFEIDTGVPRTPVVITQPATNITRSSAIAHGEITIIGASFASERGFEWGISPGVYPNSVTETGTFDIGHYALSLTRLPSFVTIYYRAKARNVEGWGYGSEVTFFTADPPAVITQSIADVTLNSATGRGYITDTGGLDCDERGFEWGISPGVYPNIVTETGVFGTGAYSLSLIGLPLDSVIYYRARVRNPIGLSHGDEVSFTTGLVVVPTVVTHHATHIEHTSMTVHGEITSTGGEDCDQTGFDWGISPGLYTDSMTAIGAWAVKAFNEILLFLPIGTIIYFRAKARNSAGWGYGNEMLALTQGIPRVETWPATRVTLTSALITARILDTGGRGWHCDERGFDWGFSPGVYIDTVTETGTFGTGYYVLPLTGLPPHTRVYFRAKARNRAGWGYGAEATFITAPPTVTTHGPAEIHATHVAGRGVITDVGGGHCSEMGFEWGLSSGVYPNSVTEAGWFWTQPFSLIITGLPDNAMIYYRAKARNDAGWGYGDEVVFITQEIVIPTVITPNARDIRAFSAIGEGEIIDWGWEDASEWGFEWGTSSGVYPNDAIDRGSFTARFGEKEAVFTRLITGLPMDTVIYYRAKARNSAGWGYGEERSFKTRLLILPSVTTLHPTNIDEVSAVGQGFIGDDGGEDCDVRGFEWGLSSGVYPNDVTVTGAFRTGHYALSLTGLPSFVTIYYRAKVRNSLGWVYGGEVTFIPQHYPAVVTGFPTGITPTSAIGHGRIVDIGVELCDERGFDWGTSPGVYPNSVTQTGSFGTGDFSLPLTSLPSFVAIHYRAKAHNVTGWGYGNEMMFVTVHTPVVRTEGVLNITKNSATAYGEIIDWGWEIASERGFEWKRPADPVATSVTQTGSFGSGRFSLPLIGLPSHTTIQVRAKARNSAGWGYGGWISFITVYPPRVSTSYTTWILATSVRAWGHITGIGWERASERGFDWGTSPGVYPNSVTETGTFDIGYYSLPLTGLPVNTVIFYRAKARNSAGWSYGREMAVSTAGFPRVTTLGLVVIEGVVKIRATEALALGEITFSGSDWEACSEWGFEWGTSPGSYPNSVTVTGIFRSGAWRRLLYSLLLTGLPPNTTIYFRAKTKNPVGWGYGAEMTFVTAHAPVAITHSADIRAASATGRGEITSTGSDWERCSVRGFEWGFSPGVYINTVTETGIFDKGHYSLNLTGLPSLTTIFYRAKAYNPAGWGYGNEMSFVTLELFPLTIATQAATDITAISATGHGDITAWGNDYSDERGFEWGISPGVYPNIVTETGSFGMGPYSLSLTGLPVNTTIYYRARAHNPAGWSVGSETSFVTQNIVPPTVITQDVTGITGTSALLHGLISDTGWEICSEMGFEWGLSSGVYPNSVTEAGTFGVGPFSLPLTGLPMNTVIFYRAKARNSAGWGYGGERTFVTAHVPTLTTQAATDIARHSATGHGNIIDTGRMACDQRGCEWGIHSGLYIKRTIGMGIFGIGAYTRKLVHLPMGTRIYYRSVARNPMGWGYGNEVTFITLGLMPPTVITKSVTDISTNSATGRGEVVDTGGEDCDEWGFEWGTSPGVYPNSVTDIGIFRTGIYFMDLTGLPENTTIYYRAKARNPAANPTGWGYGGEVSFTTLSAAAPSVGGLPAVRVAELVLA